MINSKLGYKLKEIRKAKNLKQLDIANLLNLSTKTIQRYEKGENISADFIECFVSTLKLNDKETKDIYNLFLNNHIDGNKVVYTLEQLYNFLGYTFDCKMINNDIVYSVTIRDKTYTLKDNVLYKKMDLLLTVLDSILYHELIEK